MRPLLFLALPLLATLPAGAAERPVVIELFTSQSCSSCPPAEALLGEYARRGGDVLPLAFHVTYWNRLDWRDTFSLAAATERQVDYAKQLGESSFTPQLVVDGRHSVIGSHRDKVASAIDQAKSETKSVTTVVLSRRGSDLMVSVAAGRGSGTLTLVGFDLAHTTVVARGENAGRSITQANIVRSVRALGRWTGAAQTLTTSLPQGMDAAVLLQAPDGRILGAARLGATS